MIGMDSENSIARLEKVRFCNMETSRFGDYKIVVNLSSLSTLPLTARQLISTYNLSLSRHATAGLGSSRMQMMVRQVKVHDQGEKLRETEQGKQLNSFSSQGDAKAMKLQY